MGLLKKKVQLKEDDLIELKREDSSNLSVKVEGETNPSETLNVKSESFDGVQEYPLQVRSKRKSQSCPQGDSKNIIKNYGKALSSFASSKMAYEYLESIVSSHGYNFVNIRDFMSWIKSQKEKINSIESIRRLLITNEDDDQEARAYKIMFKEISIIFLKYFAVNWIYNGKLMHKSAHLKFRFKMLRRIQDPEHFTYLKTSAK